MNPFEVNLLPLMNPFEVNLLPLMNPLKDSLLPFIYPVRDLQPAFYLSRKRPPSCLSSTAHEAHKKGNKKPGEKTARPLGGYFKNSHSMGVKKQHTLRVCIFKTPTPWE